MSMCPSFEDVSRFLGHLAGRKDKKTLRSEAEIESLVNKWLTFVHPRAQGRFDQHQLRAFLVEVAQGIDENDDPILPASSKKCCIWHGPIRDSHPTIMFDGLLHRGKISSTHVMRLLVFMFAEDQLYFKAGDIPDGPLPMECGNCSCVNLLHLSLERASPQDGHLFL
eukprot:TRINITY_DN18345_c0_g1_i2.p1 TRINITY_DN18345_c0_g1~~TRINITY_DN18345_c0_g1_i2.p1  ORF type:complete len:188 (-),score=24.87 TRINITY_DN18345_c0_g1_i2:66-566(-)